MSDAKPQLPQTAILAREIVTVVTSLVLSLAGLAYVLGILIITIRLGAVGVPAPDLAQPRYALVGGLFLFLVSFVAAAVGAGIISFREGIARMKHHHPVTGGLQMLASLVSCFAPMIAIQFLTRFRLDFTYREAWIILAILLLSALSMGPLAQSLRLFWKSPPENQARPAHQISLTHAFLWELLTVVMSITGYSRSVYPRLSPVFGGGRPSQIVLVVAPDKISVIRMTGIAVASDGRSEAVALLFEDGSNYYVERTSGSQALTARIRKDALLLTLSPLPPG